MVHWLRTQLPMWGTWVQPRNDLHAVEQLNPLATTTEPMCCNH